MRFRLLITVAMLALCGVLASACGGAGETADYGKPPAEPEKSLAELANPRVETDNGFSDLEISDEQTLETPTVPPPATESAPPEVQEPPNPVQAGIDAAGDCLELGVAFGSLLTETLAGADGAQRVQQRANELRPYLPPDLQADLGIVTTAISTAATEGILSGTTALETPTYQAANESLNDYFFKQGCAQ